jgi:antitoxin MazE
MIKRLQAVGNSSGVIIDRPILDLLKITADTQLEVTTDGQRLIITPLGTKGAGRAAKIAKAQAKTLAKHAETFRKLAK